MLDSQQFGRSYQALSAWNPVTSKPDELGRLLSDLIPLGPRGLGNLLLAQLNPSVGDLETHAKAIMQMATIGDKLAVDAVLFPELYLVGYPIRDVITRHPFLVRENIKWLNALAERSGDTRLIVGFVEPRPDTGTIGKPYFNSVAILGNGRIEGIVRKGLLANYSEFNDWRTFEPSPWSGVFPANTLGCFNPNEWTTHGNVALIHGKRYAMTICEDIWSNAGFFVPNAPYERDIVKEQLEHQPDAILNLSASPSRGRKEGMKHSLLSHIARESGVQLVYVSQVGAVDECSFDGSSRIYDAQGELMARGTAFKPHAMLANPFLPDCNEIEPLSPGQDQPQASAKVFDPFAEYDLGRTADTLVQGIRDYFRKTGFPRAVLGLSGGLDSSVAVVLLALALGSENVLGITMPTSITPDHNQSDAEQLAKNLGIQLLHQPIGEMTQPFIAGLESQRGQLTAWGEPSANSYAKDNVQAMCRATFLRLIGNDYYALPVATSDKSEFYLGYTTVNGDMSGALAPLGDVPKTKVRLLARWLNAHSQFKQAIPDRAITKPSSADLAINPETGKVLTAEEALMPYIFADEIIWRIEVLHQDYTTMLSQPFYWERENPISPEQKRQWIDKFYSRMARSIFKWWIAPPVIIVDGNGSITKTDYHHPITSNRIRWQGHSSDEIHQILADNR